MFPDDAQQVGDDEWIECGAVNGWVLLSQDDRIRRTPASARVIVRHAAVAFCLDSANLTMQQKADRFHTNQPRILRAVRHARKQRTYGYYVVHRDGIERKTLDVVG